MVLFGYDFNIGKHKMNNAIKTFTGNLIFTAAVAAIIGLDFPIWSDVITASDMFTLVSASFFSYVVSATIGWAKVWYGVGYVISETPWWMIFFSITE